MNPLPLMDAVGAPAGLPDLTALCAEAGWHHVSRASGSIRVDLEVAGRFEQAHVTARPDAVELACELVATEGLAAVSVEAIDHCLGILSATLRGVRAWVPPGAPGGMARLEIVLAAPVTASDFSSALESLSVGCSLCGEELKLLQTPAVATWYLALRRPPASDATSPHPRNTP